MYSHPYSNGNRQQRPQPHNWSAAYIISDQPIKVRSIRKLHIPLLQYQGVQPSHIMHLRTSSSWRLTNITDGFPGLRQSSIHLKHSLRSSKMKWVVSAKMTASYSSCVTSLLSTGWYEVKKRCLNPRMVNMTCNRSTSCDWPRCAHFSLTSRILPTCGCSKYGNTWSMSSKCRISKDTSCRVKVSIEFNQS